MIIRTIRDWLRSVKAAFFPRIAEVNLDKIIAALVLPGWTCVDVGANIGVYTRRLARRVGRSGRVIAFEAFRDNARMLARANMLTGLTSRITLETMAISDGTQAEICLYAGRGSSSEEWNIMGHDVAGNMQEAVCRVPAVSLDQYFPVGTTLHFIKIDIEGAEALALRGMSRILRESRPVLFVEFHNEEGWSGRAELFSAHYDLYDMKGRKLNPAKDTQREYHCLAIPMGNTWGATWSVLAQSDQR